MSFSYYDNDKQIQQIDIQVGSKWADYQTANEKLNSIFKEVDDGDGVVQISEKMLLDQLVKQADNQVTDNILEEDELETVDVESFRYAQTFDASYYSLENIKKMYSEDRYTYTNGDVIEKATGKKVLSMSTSSQGFSTISEYGDRQGRMRIRIYDDGTARVTEEADVNNVNSGVVEYEYDRTGQLKSVYDFKTRTTYSADDIQQKLFLKNSKNPDWVNSQAISFLDGVSDKMLYKLLAEYNKDSYNSSGYFLEELSKNENIPADVREEFISRTMQRLENQAGYKQIYSNDSSQVRTSFYKSDNSYSVNFSNDIVTVKANAPDAVEHSIDLNNLVSELPLDMRAAVKAAVQKMPAEAINDLAIECDRFRSPLERKGFKGSSAGSFSLGYDRITVGIAAFDAISPETIVHELGHAIDARDCGTQSFDKSVYGHDMSIRHNVPLKNAYYTSMAKYLGVENYLVEDSETGELSLDDEGLIRDGYKTPDKQWAGENRRLIGKTYMYQLLEEGPSELYTLAMLGSSENTVRNAVTPELMEEYLKSLQYTRSLSENERHVRQ